MIFDLKSMYSTPPKYLNYPSLSRISKSEVQLNFIVNPSPSSRPTSWFVKCMMDHGGGCGVVRQ